MNNCARYEEMISALLDGELSSEEEAEIKAHISSCKECRKMYELFSGVSDAVSAELAEPPKDLKKKVMAEISAVPAKRKIVHMKPYLAAAACFVVIAAAAFSGLIPGMDFVNIPAVKMAESADAVVAPESAARGEADEGFFYRTEEKAELSEPEAEVKQEMGMPDSVSEEAEVSGMDYVGDVPDGMNAVIASIAVFPGDESLENVADAQLYDIGLEDAEKTELLGSYLPQKLPEGYGFDKASLYETTMKDAAVYRLLRVTYSEGDSGNEFVVFLMNYKPKTQKEIYEPAQLDAGLLQELGGATFHVDLGEVYLGVSPLDLSAKEVLSLIQSIKS